MMSSYEVLASDEVVQSALEDLCAAQYAENYCSFCASGSGCCAVSCDEESHSDTDNEGEKLNIFNKGMDSERNQNNKRETRRKTLTIDLSNEENLTDGEILKRLLSPLESPLSDEPLEVILEIVGEEEDEDNETDYPSEKTFQSLREKLRKISSKKPSREARQNSLYWKRQLKKIKNDLAYSNKYPEDDNFNPDYSSVEQCPSFHKANNLINEIEKCFVETAELVEKTLEASKCQVLLEQQNSNKIFSGPEGQETRNFTPTVNEALNIFDSLLNDNKNYVKHKNESFESQTNPSNYSTLSSDNNYDDNSYKNHYNFNSNYYNPYNVEEQSTYQHEGIDNEIKMKESYLFDKDIEDLFRECYEVSSVEPNNTLESRIRNLESLCSQLNKVKENILNEMKFEFPYNLNKENYDCYSSRSSSLDSQECYSVINDLIDKRLKEKLRKNKFNLGPPLMGLEGKTHKRIAEALHLNYYIENGMRREIKENGPNRNYQGNKYKTSNASDTASSFGEHIDQQEMNSESTSDMSITNYTLDSGHYSSSSSNNTSDYYRNYTLNKDSLFPSESDQTSAMSYEETLALYEDNQELQKSLLSILHSLNDIHDNFLHRRRMEMALSQQNSTFIQNHLKSEIYSANQSRNGTKVNNFYSSYSTPINELTDQKIPCNNNRETDDFEPIEKIIRVSDELKNLWLYSPKDLHLRTRKPVRSVSFNKGTKLYKQFSDYYDDSISDDYDVTESINSNKSLSLPNLSLTQNEQYDMNSNSSSLSSPASTPVDEQKQHNQQEYQIKGYNINEPKNFFVDSFVKKVREENINNYEVTIDFLRKLMNTSKLEFDDDSLNAKGNFTKQAENSRNYNAF